MYNLWHLEVTRDGHHLNGILACEQQVPRVEKVQDNGEALHSSNIQVCDGGLVRRLAFGQTVEGFEVAAARHQDVLVCAEHPVRDDDVDVTEDATFALLVQLLEKLVAVGVLIGLVAVVFLWAISGGVAIVWGPLRLLLHEREEKLELLLT